MARSKKTISRGVKDKKVIGNEVYFKMPSHNNTRDYHYKGLLDNISRIRNITQITKEVYENV